MYYPKGVISSTVSVFQENGSLDFDGIVENMRFQKQAGIKEVCVLGGTGEAASMTQNERHAVMDAAMAASDGLHVVMGALAGSIDEIEADICKAKDIGASASMVMVPPFFRPSAADIENLILRYSAIGQPLVLFNSPSRSGYSMSAELIERLARIPNVVGIKDSSGSMILAQDVRVSCPRPFSLLTGGDDLYFPTLALGGDGGILASAAVIPEVCAALDRAVSENDYELARKCHYAIKILNDLLYKASHPVPLKTCMHYRGLPSGKCRLPFTDIPENDKEKLKAAMREIRQSLEGVVTFVDQYPIPKASA